MDAPTKTHLDANFWGHHRVSLPLYCSALVDVDTGHLSNLCEQNKQRFVFKMYNYSPPTKLLRIIQSLDLRSTAPSIHSLSMDTGSFSNVMIKRRNEGKVMQTAKSRVDCHCGSECVLDMLKPGLYDVKHTSAPSRPTWYSSRYKYIQCTLRLVLVERASADMQTFTIHNSHTHKCIAAQVQY